MGKKAPRADSYYLHEDSKIQCALSFSVSLSFCEKLLEYKEFGIIGSHTGSYHHILQGSLNHSLSSQFLSGLLMLPQNLYEKPYLI